MIHELSFGSASSKNHLFYSLSHQEARWYVECYFAGRSGSLTLFLFRRCLSRIRCISHRTSTQVQLSKELLLIISSTLNKRSAFLNNYNWTNIHKSFQLEIEVIVTPSSISTTSSPYCYQDALIFLYKVIPLNDII